MLENILKLRCLMQGKNCINHEERNVGGLNLQGENCKDHQKEKKFETKTYTVVKASNQSYTKFSVIIAQNPELHKAYSFPWSLLKPKAAQNTFCPLPWSWLKPRAALGTCRFEFGNCKPRNKAMMKMLKQIGFGPNI